MNTPSPAQMIAAARERDPLLELEACCRSTDCPAREVTIRVKDYARELLVLLKRRGGLHCPVCGESIALHHALTLEEAEARRRQDARGSVAADMYMRDHGTPFVPASVLTDTRLPPTPPGWWADTDPDSTRNERGGHDADTQP